MAVTIIGEKPSEIHALLQEISVCVGAEPDGGVLEMTAPKLEQIKEAFQIKDEEINSVMDGGGLDAAVVSLVVERVALLSTQL